MRTSPKGRPHINNILTYKQPALHPNIFRRLQLLRMLALVLPLLGLIVVGNVPTAPTSPSIISLTASHVDPSESQPDNISKPIPKISGLNVKANIPNLFQYCNLGFVKGVRPWFSGLNSNIYLYVGVAFGWIVFAGGCFIVFNTGTKPDNTTPEQKKDPTVVITNSSHQSFHHIYIQNNHLTPEKKSTQKANTTQLSNKDTTDSNKPSQEVSNLLQKKHHVSQINLQTEDSLPNPLPRKTIEYTDEEYPDIPWDEQYSTKHHKIFSTEELKCTMEENPGLAERLGKNSKKPSSTTNSDTANTSKLIDRYELQIQYEKYDIKPIVINKKKMSEKLDELDEQEEEKKKQQEKEKDEKRQKEEEKRKKLEQKRIDEEFKQEMNSLGQNTEETEKLWG
ncbi:MAG: hypothetical protein ACPGC9_00760 [Cytophagales bacterium]